MHYIHKEKCNILVNNSAGLYFLIYDLNILVEFILCVSFYSTFLEAAECARSHEEILTLR